MSVKNVLEPAFDFIEGQREQGNVLVHCAAGVSRSCTLLISYMMKKYKYPYKKCLELVKAARPVANPNQGFVVQLKAYQKSLNIIWYGIGEGSITFLHFSSSFCMTMISWVGVRVIIHSLLLFMTDLGHISTYDAFNIFPFFKDRRDSSQGFPSCFQDLGSSVFILWVF